MKAYLNNYRMSPRKVRLVADAVKNKNVAKADVVLSFMPKKAARTIRTLIRSAVSNAVNNGGIQTEHLFVKNVEVNQGVTLKRWRARARGSASPINKRTSNVSVTLVEKTDTKAVPEKKVEVKKAKVESPRTSSLDKTRDTSGQSKKTNSKTN